MVHNGRVMIRSGKPIAPRSLGGSVLALGCGALLAWQAFMPTAYLYQGPGPAVDVAGEHNGEKVIELTNTDAETYPSDTVLMMTTVSTFGNADTSVMGAAALQALLDDHRDLIPVRSLYSADVRAADVRQASLAMMEGSQNDAVVAGYGLAGIDVPVTVTIAGFTEGTHASGLLREGDEITKLSYGEDSMVPLTVQDMRDFLEKIDPGQKVTVSYVRDGEENSVEIETMPRPADQGQGSLLGISLYTSLADDVPNAKILVGNIGGPSAGQMFALEIYDQLTPGSLAGDAVIAGTGTIDAYGNVGPIGGIKFKMVGSHDTGADYFLAPASNCDEVVGFEPDGMEVFAVETLEDSLAVIDGINSDNLEGLPRCH